MWGGGGGIYWGRKEVSDFKGIAVLFAWVSILENQLKSYVDLYASLDLALSLTVQLLRRHKKGIIVHEDHEIETKSSV
ncbi:hypothetical protein TorRG33x02_047400 [Trema orientale]|uniref:Uncharacterized protein n=1 Tax=Trema orientale TaxID=63057 RepID=A0A2P5FPA7_TREOI|nr:hypothetical protein TorRG33x02_047400 [Trema orientale]